MVNVSVTSTAHAVTGGEFDMPEQGSAYYHPTMNPHGLPPGLSGVPPVGYPPMYSGMLHSISVL